VLSTFPELAPHQGMSPFSAFSFKPPLFLALSQFLQLVDRTLQEPFARPCVRASETNGPPDEAWTPQQTGMEHGLEGGVHRLSALAKAGLELDDNPTQGGTHRLLDYNTFCEQIFPIVKRASSLKPYLDVLPHKSLLWRSIMSFIKGSWLAAKQSTGHLSWEQYKHIGKKQGRLIGQQRKAAYAFFLEYEREKKKLRFFDLQDRCSYILRCLWSQGYTHAQTCTHTHTQTHTLSLVLSLSLLLMHATHSYSGAIFKSVVIDEAQDLTQIQLSIVLCVSHPNGLYISADSCQTI
jgi:hypothetical protein